MLTSIERMMSRRGGRSARQSRYEYLAAEIEGRLAEQGPVPFSWVHGQVL